MRKFLGRIVSRIRLDGKRKNVRRQGGYVVIALAAIGLFGGIAAAAPVLNRAVGSLKANDSSPANDSGARSAAEHALWRLQYDPTVHDEMTGSPFTTSYDLVFPDGTATVTIVGTEPPLNDGLSAALSVTPDIVLPDTPTEVTFTLEVRNDDHIAHDLTSVSADPMGNPDFAYVSGSTSGFTTQAPTYQASKWTWDLLTPVSVPALGGVVSMTWRMIVDENVGNYWTKASVKFDGFHSFDAPMTGNVRVAAPSDISVTTTVTPGIVEAGEPQRHTYEITVENLSANDYTLKSIKHFSPIPREDVAFIWGSTTGPTTGNPQENHDSLGNDRYEWTWTISDYPLPASGEVVLTFEMDATLRPGTYFIESSAIAQEDSPSGQQVTASTGDDAPIVAVRIYDIHVEFNGMEIDIEALLTSAGLDIISWDES